MPRNAWSLFLAVAFFFLIANPADAAPEGVGGLNVAVRNLDMSPVADADTDAIGYFSVPELSMGDYLLVITDPLVPEFLHQQHLTVPADPVLTLLHGRITSDPEVDISFAVTASLFDEAALPPAETYTIKMKFKWNGNSMRSSGKFWVFVRGGDVSIIEDVILSTDQGSLSAAASQINDEGTMLKADFSKAEAYRNLIPPDAGRGDTVDVTISVVTPAGTQHEVVTVRILGKK